MSALAKAWLILTGIFLVGVITGSALTIGVASHYRRNHAEADIRTHWFAYLDQRLNLTAEQQSQIRPIITDASMRLQLLRRQEIGEGSQIMRSTDDKILALLTPDQKVELQKVQAEREQLFSNRVRAWGGPDGAGGPPREHPNKALREMLEHSGANDRMTPSMMESPTNVPPPPTEHVQ